MVHRQFFAVILAVTLSILAQRANVAAQHEPAMKELPSLRIRSPSKGATVSSPVVVVFETRADLSKMTMGAHAMRETDPHLHIDLDKRITMPTIKQLTKVGANRYRFNLGKATPGQHTIRIYWADAKVHKPMGPVQVIAITVK